MYFVFLLKHFGFFRTYGTLRHPDHHLRPKFDQIACELGVHDRELLTNGPGVESIRGRLGEDVDTTGDLYDDLQRAYLGMSTTR